MRLEELHYGMKVRHPEYGVGLVQSISEHTIEVKFDDGKRTISPIGSGLEPEEARADLSGLKMPIQQMIQEIVEETLEQTGFEKLDYEVHELAKRWIGGKVILKPFDISQQAKEIPIEVFFHKIVMMRNNLRVLEQKLNASDKIESIEKFDWHQYITRCYGSMTTFNLLFQHKEDQFGAQKPES